MEREGVEKMVVEELTNGSATRCQGRVVYVHRSRARNP